MAAMMSGPLKNDLKKLVIKMYPWDLPNMLCVEKYALMEKAFADDTPIGLAMAAPSKECHPRWEKKSHQHSQSPLQRQNNGGWNHRSQSPSRRIRQPSASEKYNNYTSLTVPQKEVLLQVGLELPEPQLMRTRPEHHRDLNKYCFYHRDHDHDTEDCHQLHDEIERLIK